MMTTRRDKRLHRLTGSLRHYLAVCDTVRAWLRAPQSWSSWMLVLGIVCVILQPGTAWAETVYLPDSQGYLRPVIPRISPNFSGGLYYDVNGKPIFIMKDADLSRYNLGGGNRQSVRINPPPPQKAAISADRRYYVFVDMHGRLVKEPRHPRGRPKETFQGPDGRMYQNYRDLFGYIRASRVQLRNGLIYADANSRSRMLKYDWRRGWYSTAVVPMPMPTIPDYR